MTDAFDSEDLFAKLPDEAARTQLIEKHLPLARYFANRFTNRGEPQDDLVQVASMALVKAVDSFDTSRGVKFSTYAATVIIGGLKRHFRDSTWSLRVPRRMQERVRLVRSVTEELRSTLSRSPTIADIAAEARLEIDEVVEAIEAASAYTTGSLDQPAADGNEFAAPPAEDALEAFETIEDRTVLLDAMSSLDDRGRHILYLRYFREQSQAEIADRLGISQMHVSRLLKRSLAKLKETISDSAAS